MKRIDLKAITIIAAIIAVLCTTNPVIDEMRGMNSGSIDLNRQVYAYMEKEGNQQQVFSSSISLNGNKSSNACVYFVSEVLRKNNIWVSKRTANTAELVSTLKYKGWKKKYNYEDLKPGDIVFTTDSSGNKAGNPSHTYVFMGWTSKDSYDYAYVCDNQAKDYGNEIYHVRNVRNIAYVDGKLKNAFSFFMRPY